LINGRKWGTEIARSDAKCSNFEFLISL
jgi:hypothetical protein